MLKEGDKAPEIKLQTDADEPFQLSKLKGQKVVLYFFPRADTPGCTIEAQEFRDAIKQFNKKGSVVLGISPDTPAAQARFKTKHNLPFTLLCDVDKKVAVAYDVLKEKNMYGKKVMGIARTTFLIGGDGKIEKIFSNVKAAGHAAQVLSVL